MYLEETSIAQVEQTLHTQVGFPNPTGATQPYNNH